jgi:hypothetical protein
MNAVLNSDQTGVKAALKALMAEHGAWLTLRAAVGAAVGLALRRRERLLLPQQLSGHLRQDIGLPHNPASRKYWELR